MLHAKESEYFTLSEQLVHSGVQVPTSAGIWHSAGQEL